MIEALKGEEIVNKAGGRFKVCALIQRRLVQLLDGARPLVDRHHPTDPGRMRTDLEIVIEEILTDKITLEHESGATLPGPAPQTKRLPASAN
ncbi:MAG TPA: DNA-directed RNA polymerase subunit omega [Phycisphaerales bacterium]|nr:DNA-directed RNA polymerase subunit omega [Phycisphaerales bacterium]